MENLQPLSIYQRINNSIAAGLLPDILKQARTTPTFKTVEMNHLYNNYRKIYVFPIFS